MSPKTVRRAGVRTPDDHVIVLFGATGDLAKRKLFPGLFHLDAAGLLPPDFRIIGSGHSAAVSNEEFREHVHDSIGEFGRRELTDEHWARFAPKLSFAAASADDGSGLLRAVEDAESEIGGSVRRLYHLAIPPVAFASMVEMLGSSGLARGARVIVEKPFGTDLLSAQSLNETIHSVFDESQIFRIDHFLGKESVDNILALRFSNGMTEPIWNRDHIDCVQIDVPETLSIEGRAGFYEQTGAFRDMVVTHLFQVLGFVAMEPPVALDARSLRDEKTKVFRAMSALDPARVVRGQYESYRDSDGVADDSEAETFVALEVEVDNWRWAGVPFYLRTGKALAERRQVVTLTFRKPPVAMFPDDAMSEGPRPNELVIDFHDPGSITTHFSVKRPGPAMRLSPAIMTFEYGESFSAAQQLEGYERLIHDAMIGDQTLFTRSDGIERLWELSSPLLEAPPPVEPYRNGSWGPETIHDLVAPREWHFPEE